MRKIIKGREMFVKIKGKKKGVNEENLGDIMFLIIYRKIIILVLINVYGIIL